MTASHQDCAKSRMARRRRAIAEAKTAFAALPPERQHALLYDFQSSNDEAQFIIDQCRRGVGGL